MRGNIKRRKHLEHIGSKEDCLVILVPTLAPVLVPVLLPPLPLLVVHIGLIV